MHVCGCMCVRAFVSSAYTCVWACVYCARIHSYRIVHAFTSVSAHVGACVTHACVQAEVMQGERAPVMAWVLCHSESAWLWDWVPMRVWTFNSCVTALVTAFDFVLFLLLCFLTLS